MLRTICHAQLGHRAEAQAALAELESLFPGFCANAEEAFASWNLDPTLAEMIADGLIKASEHL